MLFQKLLIILLAVLVVGTSLIAWNVKLQIREMQRLQTRVTNIEIVINHDMRTVPKEEKAEREYSAFRL